jgi:hypothetical protein
MIGYSEQFGDEVRRVLADSRQSPNSIEALSERRLSHMTVRRMMKGFPPSSDHIIEFADALGKAMEWTHEQRKEVADRLLSLVQSRAEYRLGVTYAFVQA